MTSDDIRTLRKELGITQRQLAEALKVHVELVREWERDEQFPTRSHVRAMEALRLNPPVRTPANKSISPYRILADPSFYPLLRKLLAHAELRAAVAKLAEAFPDPVDTSDP